MHFGSQIGLDGQRDDKGSDASDQISDVKNDLSGRDAHVDILPIRSVERAVRQITIFAR